MNVILHTWHNHVLLLIANDLEDGDCSVITYLLIQEQILNKIPRKIEKIINQYNKGDLNEEKHWRLWIRFL